MITEHTCRVCDNKAENKEYILKEAMFGSSKGMGEEFTYFQCSSCQCLQIGSYPKDMDRYYPEDYVSLKKREGGKLNLIKRFFAESKSKAYLSDGADRGGNGKVSKYLAWAGGGNCSLDSKILDVGCGSGKLLLQYYKLGFKNLLGVDPFVDKDKEFENGIKILKQDIFGVSRDSKFDFIIMSHTLEHMMDQEKVLTRATELLNDDGCIFIRIPISDSHAWREYREHWINADPPRHFYLHSLKSLSLLAKKCSLDIDRIDYEAQAFGLFGSEQSRRGVSLKDSNSYWVNKESDLFTDKEILDFENKTKELNESGDGDFAIFYLFKDGGKKKSL